MYVWESAELARENYAQACARVGVERLAREQAGCGICRHPFSSHFDDGDQERGCVACGPGLAHVEDEGHLAATGGEDCRCPGFRRGRTLPVAMPPMSCGVSPTGGGSFGPMLGAPSVGVPAAAPRPVISGNVAVMGMPTPGGGGILGQTSSGQSGPAAPSPGIPQI